MTRKIALTILSAVLLTGGANVASAEDEPRQAMHCRAICTYYATGICYQWKTLCELPGPIQRYPRKQKLSEQNLSPTPDSHSLRMK